jgi:hypothetical protein
MVVVATPLNPPSELDTVKLPLVDAGVKSAADTPTPETVNGITAPLVTPVVVNVNVMELVSASPGVDVILYVGSQYLIITIPDPPLPPRVLPAPPPPPPPVFGAPAWAAPAP